MNLSDITLSNISNYIQGNLTYLGDKMNFLPNYKKEQILYRATQCPKECASKGYCNYCKCDYPQKLYVKHSCNEGKDLPDIMEEKEWKEYKQKLIEKRNAENSKNSPSSNTGQ